MVERYVAPSALTCIASIALFHACMSSVDCDHKAKPGLDVEVRDAQDGTAICDAIVSATGQGITHTISSAPSCRYIGLLDRAGTFVVLAERDGYQSNGTEVIVERGDCGVHTEAITIHLEPLPQ